MEQYQQKRLKLSNDQQINYIQINPNGQTDVVFVHGNFSSWGWWKDVLQIIQLNSNYHIIALDQRGFGKSSYKNPVRRFTHHSQDLIDFIQLKKLKNVVLIGWSYGGAISMKAAQLAPELISKIIPTASVSHLGLQFTNQKGQKCYTRQQIYTSPKTKYAQDVRRQKNYEAQKMIFDLVLFTKMPNYPEQRKKQYIQSSFDQAQYLDVLESLANSDINIDKIYTKTLMIHGRNDLIIKIDTVEQTGRKLGNSLQIWQDHAHMLPVQDAKRYVYRISRFIDQKLIKSKI